MEKETEAVTDTTPKIEVDYQFKIKLQAEFNKGLALFRQQVSAPKKNGHVSYGRSKGSSTKYDYVLLEDLIKAIDDGLKDTGLAWYQDCETAQGVVRVRTIVTHENGYSKSSSWLEFKTSGNPQDVGSSMTYAKRYSLGTTFGVSSEADDDAQNTTQQQPQATARSNARDNAQGDPRDQNQGASQTNSNSRGTENGIKNKLKLIGIYTEQIAKITKDNPQSIGDNVMRDIVQGWGGTHDEWKQITEQDATEACNRLQALKEALPVSA